jgi:hypothetical protein
MGVTSATILPLNMEILGEMLGLGGAGILLAAPGAVQGGRGRNQRRQHVFTSDPSL